MADSPYLDTAAVAKSIQRTLSDVQEAANLSDRLGHPHVGESLPDLHERLLVTRAAMSRVSEIVGTLVRVQGSVRGSVIDRKGALLEAEAGVVNEKKFTLGEDYSSAQEKNARLASKTMEERISLRSVEKLSTDVDSALEYSRVRHRELDRAVRDVDTRLRILTMDRNFDG